MGRVAVDFGVGQGAKRSADNRCDLGQASNEGQRQNQRNPRGREAEGQLPASLGRCKCSGASAKRLRAVSHSSGRFTEAPLHRSRATHPSISTLSHAENTLWAKATTDYRRTPKPFKRT